MRTSAQAILSGWEAALKCDNIRQRMTEVLEKKRLEEMVAAIIAAAEGPLQPVYGRRMTRPVLGILSLWDLVALVGRDSAGAYCIGVGLGSLRLLDLFSACLCSIICDQRIEAQNRTQRILGSVLYDYARLLVNRLRHWSLDPTLGLARPYGFVKFELGSLVPESAQRMHHFYLEILVTWMLAHEIAHIANGDLDSTAQQPVLGMAEAGVPLSVSTPRPETESRADLDALRIVFEGHRDIVPPAFTAVAFFLGLLAIIERISTEPVFAGPRHPAPLERLQHLIEMLPVALPGVNDDTIARLRAIGEDMRSFSNGLSDWILREPRDFRISPTVIEDYQENAPGNDNAAEAAIRNNAGDAQRGDGNLDAALALYSEAESLLRLADYGEGHRIVYANLIQTTASMSRHAEARRWICEAVRIARSNHDKPTIIYLLDIYAGLATQCTSSRSEAHRELRILLSECDAEVQGALNLVKPAEEPL